jgi:5-methylcytosine-specific restriction endonuclease McrA
MPCLNCESPTTNPKFCSSSCSAKYNNRGRKRSEASRKKVADALRGRVGWSRGVKQSPDHIAARMAGFSPEKRMQAIEKTRQKAKARLQERFRKIEQDTPVSERSLRRYLVDTIGKCMGCSITEWLSQPLVLEIHHIDGNDKHNKLSNVQLLCPNCHSLTPTHRNKKRP